jgi:hypothetical protein
LRIRWASSTPAIVSAAFANDLNPAIDAPRRLIARWSCSMRVLRYLLVHRIHVCGTSGHARSASSFSTSGQRSGSLPNAPGCTRTDG